MNNALPILAMVATAFATLMMLVFCMAMGANASPEQIAALKRWMIGLSLLGVAGIVAGVVLLRSSQPGLAAAVSIAPPVIMGIALVVALLK